MAQNKNNLKIKQFVRLNAEQKKEIHLRAQKCGLSDSTYLRLVISRHLKKAA